MRQRYLIAMLCFSCEVGAPSASKQSTLKEDSDSFTIVANKKETTPLTNSQPTSTETTTQLSFTIERAELESKLKDPGVLAKEARIVPNMKEGVFDGVKVFGIRASSFVATLGLQNGDLIQRINGAPIDSLEKTLSLLPNAETKDLWKISLLRKGAPVEITITVK